MKPAFLARNRPPRFLAAVAVLVAGGCGLESETSAESSDAAEEADAGPPPARVEVRGTAEEPLREGFVLVDSDCADDTRENPGLGPLDIQVPAGWEIRKGGGFNGPREGDMSVNVGSVRRTLSVGMQDNFQGAAPEERAGEDARPVGTVDWSGDQVRVFFGAGGYTAYFPAISIQYSPDVYAVVQLGGRGRGDVSELDRDEVLTVFETARLDPCVVNSYFGESANVDIVYADDR